MSSCLAQGFQAGLGVQLSKLRCGHVQAAKTNHAWGRQDWSLHVVQYGEGRGTADAWLTFLILLKFLITCFAWPQ